MQNGLTDSSSHALNDSGIRCPLSRLVDASSHISSGPVATERQLRRTPRWGLTGLRLRVGACYPAQVSMREGWAKNEIHPKSRLAILLFLPDIIWQKLFSKRFVLDFWKMH